MGGSSAFIPSMYVRLYVTSCHFYSVAQIIYLYCMAAVNLLLRVVEPPVYILQFSRKLYVCKI